MSLCISKFDQEHMFEFYAHRHHQYQHPQQQHICDAPRSSMATTSELQHHLEESNLFYLKLEKQLANTNAKIRDLEQRHRYRHRLQEQFLVSVVGLLKLFNIMIQQQDNPKCNPNCNEQQLQPLLLGRATKTRHMKGELVQIVRLWPWRFVIMVTLIPLVLLHHGSQRQRQMSPSTIGSFIMKEEGSLPSPRSTAAMGQPTNLGMVWLSNLEAPHLPDDHNLTGFARGELASEYTAPTEQGNLSNSDYVSLYSTSLTGSGPITHQAEITVSRPSTGASEDEVHQFQAATDKSVLRHKIQCCEENETTSPESQVIAKEGFLTSITTCRSIDIDKQDTMCGLSPSDSVDWLNVEPTRESYNHHHQGSKDIDKKEKILELSHWDSVDWLNVEPERGSKNSPHQGSKDIDKKEKMRGLSHWDSVDGLIVEPTRDSSGHHHRGSQERTSVMGLPNTPIDDTDSVYSTSQRRVQQRLKKLLEGFPLSKLGGILEPPSEYEHINLSKSYSKASRRAQERLKKLLEGFSRSKLGGMLEPPSEYEHISVSKIYSKASRRAQERLKKLLEGFPLSKLDSIRSKSQRRAQERLKKLREGFPWSKLDNVRSTSQRRAQERLKKLLEGFPWSKLDNVRSTSQRQAQEHLKKLLEGFPGSKLEGILEPPSTGQSTLIGGERTHRLSYTLVGLL